MNKLLGKRITTLRMAANLTQEQVAEQIGISRQKYARIENGMSNITLDSLSKIAEILNVSISDITRVLDEQSMVKHKDKKESSSNQIFEMLDLFYANKRIYNRLQNFVNS